MNNRKIYIVTLYGNTNFGNRLQNFALQKKIENLGLLLPITLVIREKTIIRIKKIVKNVLCKENKILKRRESTFIKFNKKFIRKKIGSFNKIIKESNQNDMFIYGSDQIWHPYSIKSNNFITYCNNKSFSYAASFGINNTDKLNSSDLDRFIKKLNTMKNISVREDRGKEIVEELTGRKDVKVLVDPTMLLTPEEWDNIMKKPNKLKSKKYILNYFLGELSEERKKEIERIAKENKCDIINLMDKNDPLYVSGPSEFLYLEKNAFLICTDSFHSCVFALLYNKPFIIFDREQEGIENMNSRIDTLINMFKLKSRRFNGKITKDNLKHDYTEAYKILEKERKKSNKFLRKALDLDK